MRIHVVLISLFLVFLSITLLSVPGSDNSYLCGEFPCNVDIQGEIYTSSPPKTWECENRGSNSILHWSRTYGGTEDDRAKSLVQTTDGGYAIAGWTESYGKGNHDFWLVKTDADGTAEWNRSYGRSGHDLASSLIQTADGGFALLGETYTGEIGHYDFLLVKTSVDGTEQWNKTYGGASEEKAFSLIQTADGGFALAGKTVSYGDAHGDFWLVKTTENGTEQWNRAYGEYGCDIARSLIQTTDGGFAMAGYTRSHGAGSSDFWLVKTTVDGTLEWNCTYGGSEGDSVSSLIQTVDGGYAMAGWTESYGTGNQNFWLVKTGANGTAEWNQSYGELGNGYVSSLVQAANGRIYMCGTTSYSKDGVYACFDTCLVATNTDGKILWNRTFGGKGIDLARSLILTADSDLVLAGFTNSYGEGDHDFWLVRTTSVTSKDAGLFVPVTSVIIAFLTITGINWILKRVKKARVG